MIVIVTAVASTVAIIVMYRKYASCDLNTAFITITALSCTVLTFMSGA